MSLVELFCHVDDFCQSFRPTWDHQLLSSGGKDPAPGQAAQSERNDDNRDPFSSVELSHLQSLLPGACSGTPAQRVPTTGQLWAFCGAHAPHHRAAERLSAQPVWQLQRDLLRRLDAAGRVP